MTRILDEVAPNQTIVTRRRSVHWWTPQIKELRGKSNHLRRVYQRKLRRTNADACLPEKEAMKKVKLELTKLIKRSKEDAWRELCRLVETDPWGRPYRLVMGKLCRKPPMPGTIIPGRMQTIVEGLFPTHQDKETTIWTTNEEPVFVTETELNQATSSLKANKSPGPDDVTNEILKKVIELRSRLILDIFNRCLLQASFPTIWKTARLVLIRKAGKPLDEPSSYRPLCMLNTIGKLFEKILDNRIRDFLETNDCLAPNQYGFRRGRSTIDAATRLREIVDGCRANVRNMVGLLTLDVRNAFNSAPWAGIIEAVTGKKLPTQTCKLLDDYFHDRSLLYEAAGKEVKKELTAGVPQGSVLGPTMWNILYDGLLREQMPEGVELIAYADDVAITARANENYKVERMLEDAAEKVIKWLEDTGIELAIQKSETILFTRKRKHNQINVVIRGQTITSKGTIKYLGLHLDSKLKFDEHARVAANKADEATNRLTRIMPNTGGAKSHRRKLLASVTQSIMLYGAPVWAKHMGRKGWNILDKSNRKMGLRVVAAYRTVSKEAVEVIACMPPPELIAEYRRSIHVAEERQGAEEKMIQAWQARWDRGEKGRWTYKLITDIRSWYKRRHGNIDFHLTQALTGHGCFQAYLKRFGKTNSEACVFCAHPADDVLHTLFECDAWEERRRTCCIMIEADISPENLVKFMLSSPEKWDTISKFINEVLKKKEEEERRRQRERAL